VLCLNFRSLNQPWVISSWLALAIIDPWLEEGHWRGLLMDAASRWPGWIAIAYTTVWFGLSHPLLLAAGGQRQGTFGSTGLLRHSFHGHDLIRGLLENPQLAVAIFSHRVVDLLSVSVLVSLNRAVLGK